MFVMKRFLKWLPVAFIIGAFGVVGYYYQMQERLIFRCKRLDPAHEFHFETAFEEVSLPVGKGETINGLHFFTEGKSKGVVLYLHGQGRNLLYWGERAETYVHHGYDVFVIDYRGFGKSTDNLTEENLMIDSIAAYDYLKKRYNEDEIIIHGVSLGTSMASYVATKNQPKMCILISPYYNMIETAHFNKPILSRSVLKIILKYHLRTDTWISKVNCPLYIFHGTEDDLIPYSQSEMIVKKLEDTSVDYKFYSLEGCGHNYVHQNGIYIEEINKLLGPSTMVTSHKS